MPKPWVVASPDLAVDDVTRLFAQANIDRAPAIQGDLRGMISVQDILTQSDFIENPRVPLLERTLQAAVAEARAAVAQPGPDADAARTAWETVNEVEAELAFCRKEVPAKAARKQCGETPAAMPALL